MGWTLHHAILVTTHNEQAIVRAFDEASYLVLPCVVTPSPVEVWWTLLIPPDGSKEGWPESTEGDERRKQMKGWLDNQRDPDDHSSPYSWVEVEYGETGDRTPFGWPMFSNVIDSDDRRDVGYDADHPVMM